MTQGYFRGSEGPKITPTIPRILPHFALGRDIDTHRFKSIIGADNFDNVGPRGDIVHSKTSIGSGTKQRDRNIYESGVQRCRFKVMFCKYISNFT